MAVTKSIQFLPEVFRTDTNRKFLNATVDQLISEPRLKKINGYIGRKLAPSYRNTDSYLPEPTTERQNYQLESSLVIKNPTTGKVEFVTTYTDLLNQIAYNGGIVDNHDRLFDSEYYSYDPKIDFDKLINFSQYYWLENGPDAVTVSALGVPLNYTFNVVYNSVNNTYSFTGQGDTPSPTITLARGGVYDFVINEPGNPFYIQGKPGIRGVDPLNPNISTREVLGVNNNGTDQGVIRFTVPLENAQEQWTSMPLAATADYATKLGYRQVQGANPKELASVFGGIDGTITYLTDKLIAFVKEDAIDDNFWPEAPLAIIDGVLYFDYFDAILPDSTYDPLVYVPFGKRNDIYQIKIFPDINGVERIVLYPYKTVNDGEKIKVRGGANYAGLEFYSNDGILSEVPYISAPLTTLYYQSGSVNNATGSINIIDVVSGEINPDIDIIGKLNYTSPQGVIFTNGLKVTFDSTVTDPYKNKTYYVEGVGRGIRLVLVSDLVAVEMNNDVSAPEYFTINRSSLDQNGWSRSNRWFHADVIQKTAEYLNTVANFDQKARASRPIIEFEPDIQLFNFGIVAKNPIDVLDFSVTNAFTQIQGAVCEDTESRTFIINGNEVTLVNGDRVVFAGDVDNDVRNKIYDFSIVQTTTLPDVVVYKAYIELSEDSLVEAGNSVLVKRNDTGKQWHYTGASWLLSQQKLSVNQSPLFDIIDSNGVSLSVSTEYPVSNFAGTKLFSYKVGAGTPDAVLGFPLQYKNFLTQGDIEFENNFDIDTFEYADSTGISQVKNINVGFLQKNLSLTSSTRQNIWAIADNFSRQLQEYSFVYDGVTNLFPIDDLPDVSVNLPNIKVYVNNTILSPENFAITRVVDRYAVLVNSSLITKDDTVFVLLYNKTTPLSGAHYQVPTNLDVNGRNANIQQLTLGQLRNHLTSIKSRDISIVGEVPGKSNLRDITYLQRGGSILQHSSPIIYSSLFLSHQTMSYVNGLRLAAQEYSKFKIKFLELAANMSLDVTDISGSVDAILGKINEFKNSQFAWHYSDMVPYSGMPNNTLPTYTVLTPTIKSYEITSIFQDKVVQNKAVMVYLTRTINGVTTTELLVKDRDYYFDQTRPAITFYDTFTLLYEDKITIVEYSDTDGSYVPETPSKLGLYPKFVPEIFVDNTYREPVSVIQGHDGSITPCFGDYRDSFLLELERRIYNNIKAQYNQANFNLYDYVPGKFRATGYSNSEFNQLLSTSFLSWVGTNKVDFTTNDSFVASDPFTWNYRSFRDVVNGESLSGSWRAVFKYFYDTDRPHTHPWEMLGFSEKPVWWEDRYGPAPYTGGNAILWSDLSNGYIHDGERAGFDIRYRRPNLAKFIPVDESGNLVSPAKILAVDFDSLKANTSFAVGECGPAETAWRRSSDYPFALNLALALAKPARYFSLLSNITNYNRNFITSQFLVNGTNQHISPDSILVNGYQIGSSVERSVGYINWIVDYVKNLGISNAAELIKENLASLSVQLSYKVGGYTDKKFITVLAEQSSPTSINDSIVIPDENYQIELYKGSPLSKIQYSAVIIEKSPNGYTVSGYNTSAPYFYVIPSVANNNSYVIEQSGLRGTIYKDFKQYKLPVPYGFEFNTKQQVVDFLVGYQRYLNSQGFTFNEMDADLKEKRDWVLSAKEFLHWTTQGWRTGSLLALTPVSNTLTYVNPLAVVDEIKNSPFSSRVLDINSKVIKRNNFTVFRENNEFKFIANNEQSIGFAELNVVQHEHIVIFDNQTVFNDVIYAPELGNRQYRLKVIGSKTDLWNGSFELPGFMYSNPDVDPWVPVTDYLKGTIVSYKGKYFTALQNIPASDKFQVNFWKNIDKSELKYGVVNNLATNASQSLQYYDIDNPSYNEDIQRFGSGVIGFRNRKFFDDLGLDIPTQTKLYQGIIKQKGTNDSILAFKGAKFSNVNTDISVYENWAIRVGEYGSLDDNQFVELALDENEVVSNPAIIKFADDGEQVERGVVPYSFSDLYKISGDWNPSLFETLTPDTPTTITPLPVAGFVNQSDIDDTLFDLQDYATLTSKVDSIGTGWRLWVARDFEKQWNVYRANIVKGITFAMRYTVDSDAEFIHNEPHGLAVGDVVIVKNFDQNFDGAYRVKTVVDPTVFTVEVYQNLTSLISLQTVVGQGMLYVLRSMKVRQASDIDSVRPSTDWRDGDKVWVSDLSLDGKWGVYERSSVWNFASEFSLDSSQYVGGDQFGHSIVISPNGTVAYSGAPKSGFGKVGVLVKNSITGEWNSQSTLRPFNASISDFGYSVASGGEYLAVGSPSSYSEQGVVYLYKNQSLEQILVNPVGTAGDRFGHSVAVSSDGRFLYIGEPGSSSAYCYALNGSRSSITREISGDGTTNSFVLQTRVNDPTGLVVVDALSSKELVPYKDYTVVQSSTSDSIVSFDVTAYSVIASGKYYNVSATGGSGTDVKFDVTVNYGTNSITVELSNAGSGYVVGDELTISGTLLGGSSPAHDVAIKVTEVGTTTSVQFTSTPATGEYYSARIRSTNYTQIHRFDGISNTLYGHKVVCNSNGSAIVIAAPNETVSGEVLSGALYVYHRTVTETITDGVSGTVAVPFLCNTVRSVLLENSQLIEGTDYYVSEPQVDSTGAQYSLIQFGSAKTPNASKKLVIESNRFIQDQKITSVVGERFQFGTAMDYCLTGCNIVVSATGYRETDYQFGAVARVVNVGRIYGEVTGTTVNPQVTPGHSITINNRNVKFIFSTLDGVVDDINLANIPGITASKDGNRLKISSQVVTVGQKLDVTQGIGTALADLGIEIYKTTQVITNPTKTGEVFGVSVALKPDSTGIAIGIDNGDVVNPITFDRDRTKFDRESTYFNDIITDSGAVYVYDLMNNPYETADNPSIFVQSQKLYGPDIQTSDKFGASIKFGGDALLVGAINDNRFFAGAGSIYHYISEKSAGWNLIRTKQDRVNIERINSVFAYDSNTKVIKDYFDFIDPAKGKLLGVVDQEIDYRETFDPASYNTVSRDDVIVNPDYYWTNLYIGRTWWDLSRVSFIDYEQESLTYRSKNWGAMFPGSEVKIYEWVESQYLPSQYVAAGQSGVPKHEDDSAYVSVASVDSQTGIITQKYYYWVGDKTTVDPLIARRTLSVKSLETYITNPKDQGIPYIGFISPDSFVVYNYNDKLSSDRVVLHLEVGKSQSQNLIHSEYQLIQEGNSQQVFPRRVIEKMKDSLAGFNSQGGLVPDVSLNVNDRYGISNRPQQSMFVDRVAALETFVTTVNSIVRKYPILLITQPSKLFSQDRLPVDGYDVKLDSISQLGYLDTSVMSDGYRVLIPSHPEYEDRWIIYKFDGSTGEYVIERSQAYRTDAFWTPVDWYASDYTIGTKANHIVATYGDILSVPVAAGDIIKVLDNGNGQWLIYQVTPEFSLDLKGAQNATFIIDNDVFDYSLGSGFDSSLFSARRFDPSIGTEFVQIFDSIYNEIFVSDLKIEFSKLFFSLVNYIFTEQKSPDWIFKTSFIDVYHNLRKLEQFPSYIKDDQTFYEDYINEVKPYRTKIREYLPVYDKLDLADGNWTDFDLPSVYNSTTGTFMSPTDSDTLNSGVYSEWTANRTYKIVGFTIGNGGLNYTTAPSVEITGGGGAGATARAVINEETQQLEEIVITSAGSGYTSTPTVVINGDGQGAIAYPILRNEYIGGAVQGYNLVRSIAPTIKFDRVDYTTKVVEWEPNVPYEETIIDGFGSNLWVSSGDVIVYKNEAFVATSQSINNGEVFDYTIFNKIDSSNVLLSATDRITAYYSPTTGMTGKSLGDLIDGIRYSGVNVDGAKFDAYDFAISSNVIGFNYRGLSITSSDITSVDFIKMGFEVDMPIRVVSDYPFDFKNNGTFKILTVDNDRISVTGELETTYQMILSSPVTVTSGDIITQVNNSGNAYVLNSVVDSSVLDIIHVTTGFEQTTTVQPTAETYPIVTVGDGNAIIINGTVQSVTVREILVGGNANVTIQSLAIENTLVDSSIYSSYTDTALGTRPEDINITGGEYVDTYASHAPEELIPGRIYDTLDIKVFTNNMANTATYGYRIFHPMSRTPEFTRISAAATTTLAANLLITDEYVFVSDASVLPEPNPSAAVPGVVFINGERIHYYQRYTTTALDAAIEWQPNTSYSTGVLVDVDLGTRYANISSNVSGVLFDVVGYQNGYVASVSSNSAIPQIGSVYFINGSSLGGLDGINDAIISVTVDGTEVTYPVIGSPVLSLSTVYKVLGDISANANSYINTSNLKVVYPNTITQLRRGVDGTGAQGDHYVGSLVVDSSIQQAIPMSEVTSNVVTGSYQVADATTYKLTVFGNITANVGDYITQSNSSGNVRVLANVSAQTGYSLYNQNVSFDVAPFDDVSFEYLYNQPAGISEIEVNNSRLYTVLAVESEVGVIEVGANVVIINGEESTAYPTAFSPLGELSANSTVVLSNVSVLQSNLWLPVGTGDSLETSTLPGAVFIRGSESYRP